MKDEYTYTQLAPPPLPPKVKARALSLKIFTISQVSFPSYHYTLSARPAMV